MNRFLKKKQFALSALLLLATPHSHLLASAVDDYREYCASCHGNALHGGLAPSLLQVEPKPETWERTIRDGIAGTSMPGFGARFSAERISALAAFLQQQVKAQTQGHSLQTIEGESFSPELSKGVELVVSEIAPRLRYVGYFDTADSICYADIDLTGVRSIELDYATTGDPPGRFAVLVSQGDTEARNLGEQLAVQTGSWETFQSLTVGLSEAVTGKHQLCFAGIHQQGIFNLDKFTLSSRAADNLGTSRFTLLPDGIRYAMPQDPLEAGGHKFELEPVAQFQGKVAAMDVLPDGNLLVGMREGQLWRLSTKGQLQEIASPPKVWMPGGLISVDVHPNFASNGWIYLTFADPAENGTMTRVQRGKLKGQDWTQQEPIFTAPGTFYRDSAAHFGSAMAFKDGYLFFSIGDRGEPEKSQDLSYPSGKIHRLHDDGRIPTDNPFSADQSAYPSIWSYGHRNPQGMAIHPLTGALWSAEHGPRGGDEINLVKRGLNYGWPLVSHGTDYDGSPISESPYREGLEPPLHHWTPAIAVSRIHFYTGEQFPKWRNHLLVASLVERQVRLLHIDKGKVISDELLLGGLGRIRSVRDGLDGYVYLAFNNPNGAIYRLRPFAKVNKNGRSEQE